MDDQFLKLAAYCLIGINLTVVIPAIERFTSPSVVMSRVPSPEARETIIDQALMVGLLLISTFLAIPTDKIFLATSLALVALLSKGTGKRRIIDGLLLLTAILLGARLPWWLQSEAGIALSPLQSLLVPVLSATGFLMLSREGSIGRSSSALKTAGLALFVLATILVVMSTGAATYLPLKHGWHHWGAYIAPAQLVSAGAIPLHDVPVQYGLGPTMVIAMGCSALGCWETFYWVAGISTIVWTFLVAYLVIQLGDFRSTSAYLTALAIVFAACLLWTADPSSLIPALSTPSTTGLRFLPGLALLCWIVYLMQQGPWSAFATSIGYLLWLFAMMWSPEAGLQASVVWFTFQFWNGFPEGTDNLAPKLARLVAALALQFVSGVALLCLFFRISFGVWPLWREYALYLLYPPGPLPAYLGGSLLFVLGVLAVWVASRIPWGSECSPRGRQGFIAVVFAFAASSYYLGRSHDNNLLNLLPYYVIVLAAARGNSTSLFSARSATMMMAAILAWVPAFELKNFAEFKPAALFDFDPRKMIDSYDRTSPLSRVHLAQPPSFLAAAEAANAASSFIATGYGEPIEYFDLDLVNSRDSNPPWSALHAPSNFLYVPPALRREYLLRVADRIRRPGWVLLDKKTKSADFLHDYDAVYLRDREFDFGNYTAIRYIPRNQAPGSMN